MLKHENFYDECDWCEGGAIDLVYNRNDRTVSGEIDAETGLMTFTALRGENAVKGCRIVNFCPMCGRPVGKYKEVLDN